ncbi:multi-sensor hybrid histidine kinase [Tolypothrix tenuis PCC 7101]|uniref:Circadian input-output histidine kinase CikA n=1 Tax=Tolypothrix tenuis PCC 7101 TaxID=231146 RepID=A0A1Z4N3E7_9CYAN|nr:response regulator [Aulosira sp. FACHB-113]BAZ00172.1 multi-sensor hybrid histidine kinase [Tolypothrix tenuis PCC 7101]BAZ75907.1 multi-sensor hybrid histidine kinase [Aulosira laxa NIES-50]
MLSKLHHVKSLNRLFEQAYINTMPFKSILIVPLVLQFCGSVGLIGYLWLQNRQEAVKDLAIQLEKEICDRIEHHLDQNLITPQQINHVNWDLMQVGLLKHTNVEATENYLGKQMRFFHIQYNKFANPKGEFLGIQQLHNGRLLIKEVSQKKGIGKLYVYATDSQKNHTHLQEVKNYDPRLENWYINAVNLGKPYWSQISLWENKPEVLSISSSSPLYDRTNKLVGVVGIDLILSHMRNFLGNLNVGKGGRIFILERSGLIVSDSKNQPPYTIIQGQAKRLSAVDSQDDLIKLTTEYLLKRFGSLGFIVGKQQIRFSSTQGSYFVQVKNWRDDIGLDWLIVVVVSEADVIQQINANNNTTLLLSIAAFLAVTQLGILTTRWLLKQILRLNQSTQKITSSLWKPTGEISPVQKLGILTYPFNYMEKHLQRSITTWQAKQIFLNKSLGNSQIQPRKLLAVTPVEIANHAHMNYISQQMLAEGMVAEFSAEQLLEIYRIYLAQTKQQNRSGDGKRLVVRERLSGLRALPGESINLDNLELPHSQQMIASEALRMPIMEESEQIDLAIATATDITQGKQADKLLAEYNRLLESQVKKRTQELLKVIHKLQTTQKQLIQSQKIAARGRIAAERANRAKSQFLANMSHELRTPLNAILGFAQVMSHDSSLSAEHQENLAIINRAGEHLLNLINDILEMSKIEAGKTTLNVNSFDFIRFLGNLEEMLRFRAAAKDLLLVFEYAPNIPQYLQTDESKLRQVLLNLLGNAIKFTHQGTVTLRVRLESGDWGIENEHQSCQSLIFEIQDTGPGIAPQEIDLLFEAFGQTETGRNSQQGTGLGLAISRKYVQLMDGDITVTSTLGVGSKFTFDIQIHPASASEVKQQHCQDQIVGLAPGQPEYRILVVDDARDNRLVLVKLLTSIGFVVKEATNGQEAIAQWMEWQPHLIFMDMRMPVMDGYEATREIKAKEKSYLDRPLQLACQCSTMPLSTNSNTIIIALTASAFEEERQNILSTGCDDFIRKPFTKEVLLKKVSEHLGVEYISQIDSLQTAVINPTTEIFSTEAELMWHLSQMSPQWLANIRHAAASCSDDMILQLLEQIPPEKSPCFQLLRDLANNYQFEKIMELLTTNAE